MCIYIHTCMYVYLPGSTGIRKEIRAEKTMHKVKMTLSKKESEKKEKYTQEKLGVKEDGG